MPEGLADLFGTDQWTPTGAVKTTAQTQYDFELLVQAHVNPLTPGVIDGGGTCANILAAIPAGQQNTFEFEPRSQYGFKFRWTDANGVQWQVHGHEPDAGAVVGHVGAGAWTMRVQCGNAFMMSRQLVSDFPAIHANYTPPTFWSRCNTPLKVGLSHIVINNP
ncbi:hypothetical protein ACFQNF_19970 [Iodobacter arcticus]|uniref:Uncharacterized protein n=1 Tax=Iodobacter arcticus TaxID=590593 RepID=A0ABW2R4A1_9NEIS